MGNSGRHYLWLDGPSCRRFAHGLSRGRSRYCSLCLRSPKRRKYAVFIWRREGKRTRRVHRRNKPSDNGVRALHAIAPNLLERQFDASAPNQRWVADFTYIWTAEGWLYLAAVMDLFSRRIVGWSMQGGMTAQLVIDALMMAVWRRGKPDALLHHSDQGSQYTSEDFQQLLASQGITCSMSRKGNCWDNAAMESFFSTLKIERVNRRRYKTRNEVRADVFDYIERFYNPKRRHSTLGGISPVEFEKGYTGLTMCP